MAVNPNETLTSGDAMDRYAESFMAGMGLGGVMGGGAHAFAKPELGTKEEIAARVDNVRSELDLLRNGHETWADRVAQTTKDRADAEKEMQAESDALEKQALQDLLINQGFLVWSFHGFASSACGIAHHLPVGVYCNG